jgi:acetyltransferase-like isoleucine patch superfamily enzyme
MFRRLYEKIKIKYPTIGHLIWRIYKRKPLNKVRRKIHGKNNSVIYPHALLSSVCFDISGNNNTIEIDGGCVLNNVNFYIRGNYHEIKMDKHCRFNGGGSIWFEDNNGSLFIGENSTFENVHLAITEPHSTIKIGKDCMFAYDIDVRTGDSHSIISRTNNERINYAKDVVIDNHVWVGAHCIILKGSFISEDSVVATGSIVTQRYEEKGIIIGGNPAKKIKGHISWDRKRIYRSG